MAARILVVDDEPSLQELIAYNLKRAGYEVACAGDAETAVRMLRSAPPDLALVDWMLPGNSGITLVRTMRSDPTLCDIPVMMITARSSEHDKVFALEAGADDYITKPFSPREMLARAHALLRRLVPQSTARPVVLDSLRIDPLRHEVVAGRREIQLSPTEFRLLHFLMCHPERVHSRTQLLKHVWGSDAIIGDRTVDAHIGRLRSALQDSGHHDWIETVRGIGYRLIPPAVAARS